MTLGWALNLSEPQAHPLENGGDNACLAGLWWSLNEPMEGRHGGAQGWHTVGVLYMLIFFWSRDDVSASLDGAVRSILTPGNIAQGSTLP